MSRSKKYILVLVLLFLMGIFAVVLYVNSSLENGPQENIIETTD